MKAKQADYSSKIERTRYLSDNYKCYLIEIWKPCTSKTEVARVIQKGFDFDLSWAKNSSDMMNLLLDQYNNYHTIYSYKNLSAIKRAGNQERTDSNKVKGGLSSVNHVFQKPTNSNDLEVSYITPKFTLKIVIEDMLPFKEITYFTDFIMYKPSQSTSQNSSDIEESLKGFSPIPYREKENMMLINENVRDLSWDLLYEQFVLKTTEQYLSTNDRMILNPDNTELYK